MRARARRLCGDEKGIRGGARVRAGEACKREVARKALVLLALIAQTREGRRVSQDAAYAQATISAVLSLTQGDEITIVNYQPNDDIYGDTTSYETHFEGFLVTRT